MIAASGAQLGHPSGLLFRFWAVALTFGLFVTREYVDGIDQEPLLRGNDMIMKTAWPNSARTLESDIYMSIDQTPKGLR